MDGNQDSGLQGSLNGPALVGAELRTMRENHGWGLGDIALRLKIRPEFLEAIEDGDLAALPAPTYAAGFIRSYAEALSLDPDDILRRFRAEGMNRTRSPVLAFPEAASDHGAPPGAIALLLAIIALGGYIIWYGRSEREIRINNAVPQVPAMLARQKSAKGAPIKKAITNSPSVVTSTTRPMDISKEAPTATPLIAPPNMQPEGGTKSAITKNPHMPVPVKPAPSLTVPSILPKSFKDAQKPRLNMAERATLPKSLTVPVLPPRPSLPRKLTSQLPIASTPSVTKTSIGALTSPPANTALPSAAPADTRPATIVIVAALRSWVEVRNVAGKILFSRVMQPGESWQLPDQPGLTITTGNAGGLELIRNGVPGPPLGPPGSVVRSALITPSGTIVPPPQPFRVRHFVKHPPPRRQHWANPFAIPTTGDQ